jgi:hypothetical protein
MNNEEFKTMVNQGIQRTIAQGKPCVNVLGNCKYGLDGMRCVVGHMMTEEEHSKFKTNFGGVRTITDAGWKPELSIQQVRILSDIQHCHDALKHYKGADFTRRFQDSISEITLDI